MRIDNIFISKGNGLGWTLNFDNPLSWVVLVALLVLVALAARKPIKEFLLIVRGYWNK